MPLGAIAPSIASQPIASQSAFVFDITKVEEVYDNYTKKYNAGLTTIYN